MLPDRERVRLLVQQINSAWRNGRPEELHQYFHEDMVIVGPDLRELGKGRGPCVKSYQDFIAATTVHDYKESEPVIDVCGRTAVATYNWEIAYELNGQVLRETGQDLFVFGLENDRWQAVWRALLPSTRKD
jgi:hypothetical protein